MRRPGNLLALLLCLSLVLSGCSARERSSAEASQSVSSAAPEPPPAREEGVQEESASSAHHWENPSPEWVSDLPQAAQAQQLFVVAATEGTAARVSLHQRGEDGSWGCLLETEGCIGKNGLGKQAEGDGRTPVGAFTFNRAFGIARDPGCAIPYVQVNGNHYWSGDQRPGMHYNELVNLEELPDLDRESSEHIEDFWDQYQYCLNISYNEKGVPGKGSAIFLHCQGEHPYTLGCVAIPEKQMKQVLRLVQPECVVVIDAARELGASER